MGMKDLKGNWVDFSKRDLDPEAVKAQAVFRHPHAQVVESILTNLMSLIAKFGTFDEVLFSDHNVFQSGNLVNIKQVRLGNEDEMKRRQWLIPINIHSANSPYDYSTEEFIELRNIGDLEKHLFPTIALSDFYGRNKESYYLQRGMRPMMEFNAIFSALTIALGELRNCCYFLVRTVENRTFSFMRRNDDRMAANELLQKDSALIRLILKDEYDSSDGKLKGEYRFRADIHIASPSAALMLSHIRSKKTNPTI